LSGLIKTFPLFFFVQLQGLEAQVISQTDQEGKERLHGRFALCPPPLSKPFRFSFPLCAGLERVKLVNNVDEVKRNDTKTDKTAEYPAAHRAIDFIREIDAAAIIPDRIFLEA
jgi:hypothetical protein